MSRDEDDARLLAALTLAIRATAAAGSQDESVEARLAKFGQAMSGQHWQITVARDLRLTPAAWLGRPWHCYKLRALVRQLLSESLDPRAEAKAVDLLTRCAALIEFGVDVNAVWYRRLRGAIVTKRTSRRELRSLLRRSTVWWGTAGVGTSTTGSTGSWLRRLWSMGRPADGELMIASHHWTTKALLSMLLVLAGCATLVVAAGLVRHLLTDGLSAGLAPLIVATYTYLAIFWAAWFFGPHSWSAVRKLRQILRLRDSDH